jgi:hypothetical protein
VSWKACSLGALADQRTTRHTWGRWLDVVPRGSLCSGLLQDIARFSFRIAFDISLINGQPHGSICPESLSSAPYVPTIAMIVTHTRQTMISCCSVSKTCSPEPDLGFTAFGSPPVHFQILYRRFVEGGGKTPWIDEQTVRILSLRKGSLMRSSC